MISDGDLGPMAFWTVTILTNQKSPVKKIGEI